MSWNMQPGAEMEGLFTQRGSTRAKERLPYITLWRPWAQFVALGWKGIETRTHRRFAGLAGKTIGIVAGGHYDKDAMAAAGAYLDDAQHSYINWHTGYFSLTGLLCTAEVVEHRPLGREDEDLALIECGTERYGLVLTNVKRFDPPLAVKGGQGIRYLEQ